ncbi:MAG: serine/threonine-protein kinase [Opitutaceae bacterium]
MSTPPVTRAVSTCPRCRQPVPAEAVFGACPQCLLAAGFTSEPAAPNDAAPPAIDELASEFPQLELLELLGRGGMGAVYKARQRSLDRFVALKLFRPGLDADPTFAERFAREARALAGLNHPGIVTLYEFGRTPGGLFFILMEFVDGVNLRQLLAAGRLAPREALAIIPPLCDALQYAHDRGLVHRDIKPENILVDRLGRVKVADFGLAKLADRPDAASGVAGNANASSPLGSFNFELSEAGKVMGTPRYMAPEQRDRPEEVDHRADIYALGVVLYQMLTGELPDAKHLQPPSRRVQLDVRLDEIVLRALEKEPSLRYQHASAMKTEIEQANDGSPTSKTTGAFFSSLRSRFMDLPPELATVVVLFLAAPFLMNDFLAGPGIFRLIAVPIGIGLLLLHPVARTAALVFIGCKIFSVLFYLSPLPRAFAEHLNKQFGLVPRVFNHPKLSNYGVALVVIILSILMWAVLRRPAIRSLFSRRKSHSPAWIETAITIAVTVIFGWFSLQNVIQISAFFFEELFR